MEIQKTIVTGQNGVLFTLSNDSQYNIAIHCSQNCNVAIAENVYQLFNGYFNEQEKKEAFDAIKKASPGRNVLCTLINKEHFDWFKTNFPYYYANIIPRKGASGTSLPHQHHILLRNIGDNREPIIDTKEVEKKVVPVEKLMNIIDGCFDVTQNRKARIDLIRKEFESLKV